MRACSVEIRAAPAWSSQKPGAPIASSSSSRRRARRSGSKVITDPGELGPDLLEALIEALRRLGHAPMVAAPPEGVIPPGLTGPMGVAFTCGNATGRGLSVAYRLDGTYFENCNCEVACPCSASNLALPAS